MTCSGNVAYLVATFDGCKREDGVSKVAYAHVKECLVVDSDAVLLFDVPHTYIDSLRELTNCKVPESIFNVVSKWE